MDKMEREVKTLANAQYTEQFLEQLLSILSNCSDEDLVIDITSEALYGDR